MTAQDVKERIPNFLSVVRLLLALTVIGLYFIPHPLFVAQIVITAGVVSDKLDGSLARLWKTESDLGKRLESVVDPTFAFLSVIYCLLFLGLPPLIFGLGSLILGIGVAGRLYIKWKTGKMFYEKSQITRFGVGMVFLVLLLYVFQAPYRDWFLWPILAYGVFAGANYARMMWQFLQRERGKRPPAAAAS
jgi:phosphatidylglycerophosphate synthase